MNKIYETENLFLKELDKSSARQVLDYYMRNKAFLEEWEIIRNEEFYTLDYQEKMLEEEARYIENKNLVKLWLFKKDEEESIRLLKCMFEAMKKKWDINSSLLYKNIKSKENNIGMENLLLSSLIKEIERDEKFEFLRSNQRYLKLINQYKKQENE